MDLMGGTDLRLQSDQYSISMFGSPPSFFFFFHISVSDQTSETSVTTYYEQRTVTNNLSAL